MSFATVLPVGASSALRVFGGSLTIPERGLWEASVRVDSDQDLLGRALDLRMGETLTLRGTAIEGGVYQSTGVYRLVGGAGGWRKPIRGDSYLGPLARLATIVTDAARLAGESVRVETDRTVGPYVRFRGAASVVLNLAPAWWVDADGTTVVGPRPGGAVTARVLDRQLDARTLRIVEEEVGGVLPGKTITVDGTPLTIRAAVHSMGGGSVLHV